MSVRARDAAVGHLRLHVGLHRRRLGRIGGLGERAADRAHQLGVGGGHLADCAGRGADELARGHTVDGPAVGLTRVETTPAAARPARRSPRDRRTVRAHRRRRPGAVRARRGSGAGDRARRFPRRRQRLGAGQRAPDRRRDRPRGRELRGRRVLRLPRPAATADLRRGPLRRLRGAPPGGAADGGPPRLAVPADERSRARHPLGGVRQGRARCRGALRRAPRGLARARCRWRCRTRVRCS